jgi:hypothetical protein
LAYVGKDTDHFPAYLARWKAADLRGAATSGWHRLAISVEQDRAEIYWNGKKLPGGPFTLERGSRAGHIGAYANYTGGLGIAETKIDGLRVWNKR